jgi:hypothetical protein
MVPPRHAQLTQNGGDLVFCRGKRGAPLSANFLIRRASLDKLKDLALHRGQS